MVLYITMNGNSRTCGRSNAFALMYRRANETFYECISLDAFIKSPITPFSVFPAKAGIQSFLKSSGLPPEFIPAKAGAGVTV
jgi:hypothetical protein